MDIERINDHTVKFYISYIDIEERGFDREEIWYNRDRSEELFWEMMDEVHREEEFFLEGPLWIQVQALDKGLEVLVTKAQVSKDGQKFDLPLLEEKFKGANGDMRIEDLLDHTFNSLNDDNDSDYDEEQLDFVIKFNDFEDVIALSKQNSLDELSTKLYSFEGKYYIYVEFAENIYEEKVIENNLSILLEYGNETNITIHRIEEYGKLIIGDNVLANIRKYFT
jgi:adapter protein MecA 1/2